MEPGFAVSPPDVHILADGGHGELVCYPLSHLKKLTFKSFHP